MTQGRGVAELEPRGWFSIILCEFFLPLLEDGSGNLKHVGTPFSGPHGNDTVRVGHTAEQLTLFQLRHRLRDIGLTGDG
jgi:hypothetical protein